VAALAILAMTRLAISIGRHPGPSVERPAASLLGAVPVAVALLRRRFRDRLPTGPLSVTAERPPLGARLLAHVLVATAAALAGFLLGCELAWAGRFAAASSWRPPAPGSSLWSTPPAGSVPVRGEMASR
jgi:hypothetical protein